VNKLRYILLALLFATGATQAQGEHARRVAAELLVIKGDLQKLSAPETPNHLHKGLRERILGGIVPLDILLRLADQEARRPVQPRIVLVKKMLAAASADDLDTLGEEIDALVAHYPLHLPRLTVNDTDESLSLHRSLCLGCHSGAMSGVERPAYNLYEQSKQVSTQEMFARLLVGVRGDRVTGIDNPLNDLQLSGLLSLYRSGKGP